jgi:predicted  nucleic acid-binding Zn-ribbon protein
MTDEELKAIRERREAATATDIRALLAEVERLRQDKWNLNYQVKGLRRRIHELEDELDGDDD